MSFLQDSAFSRPRACVGDASASLCVLRGDRSLTKCSTAEDAEAHGGRDAKSSQGLPCLLQEAPILNPVDHPQEQAGSVNRTRCSSLQPAPSKTTREWFHSELHDCRPDAFERRSKSIKSNQLRPFYVGATRSIIIGQSNSEGEFS